MTEEKWIFIQHFINASLLPVNHDND